MARNDYTERIRSIIYGQALGEKPPIRKAASDASETITGSQVVFNMASGEGAYVKAGHILAAIDTTDEDDAYVLYVLSVATDAITAYHGYHGSPATPIDGLDGALLEQNPLVTEYDMHQAIDLIFARFLWPEVYNITTASLTPDLSDDQVDLPAATQRILGAYQIVGGRAIDIPYKAIRNVHTTVSANQVLGVFDAYDSSTLYYTYMKKFALGDESTYPELVQLVATGAAAVCLGASVTETKLESSSKDSQQSQREVAASTLWRDFLTMRAAWADELSTETSVGFEYDRG